MAIIEVHYNKGPNPLIVLDKVTTFFYILYKTLIQKDMMAIIASANGSFVVFTM